MYATLAEAEKAPEDAVRALSKATDAVLTGDLAFPP
jgi:hypothetical protein